MSVFGASVSLSWLFVTAECVGAAVETGRAERHREGDRREDEETLIRREEQVAPQQSERLCLRSEV